MINPKVGDIGTAVDITVVEQDPSDPTNTKTISVDVSAATLIYMKFQRPDTTGFTRVAGFKTDGTDGIVRYVTVAGDLDQPGGWKVDVEIHLSGGQWTTDIYKMKVNDILSGA